MNIYTSYFAKLKKISMPNALFLGITVYPPAWWSGENYSKLAPPSELLYFYKGQLYNKDVDLVELRHKYVQYFINKVLSVTTPQAVYEELEQKALARGKDSVVLLCFEKSSDFCHRHIISAWLNEAGYSCEEIK